MEKLLSGLEGMGLGDLEDLDLYEEKQRSREREEKNAQEAKDNEVKEEDMLYDKSYTCPICDKEFKSKTVRSGRARALGVDMDLRPRYENIDVLKYDVIACPNCGYAALPRYFPYLTPKQKKDIREKIAQNYKVREVDEAQTTYTYEMALERNKLALVNAIVKHGKNSERAYICLKTGWLLRGMNEVLNPKTEDYKKKKRENTATERQFLRNAYEGFMDARLHERPPLCGMDEMTVDYLLATLSIVFNEYENAERLIGAIILSKTANSRIKDKARDLKEILRQKMKEAESDE